MQNGVKDEKNYYGSSLEIHIFRRGGGGVPTKGKGFRQFADVRGGSQKKS